MSSDNTNSGGFGKFVPGFDFLQNLAKGAAQNIPQMPNLSNWVAPTLNVEELDKRIDELKAVHFWLDQNGKALSATIQALEVQKMTLATLKGMNFNMGDVANALKLKATDTMFSGVRKAGKTEANAGVVDPMQWWGSLTQQFQQIAASAMKDAAKNTAVDTAKNMATGVAKEALKSATGLAKAAAGGVAAGRKAAKKTGGRR
ncbi:MAG: PhaM family polyhydroxyalkanoate granule multifunctional regulatory protein [Ramlibacter sp.]